MLHITELDRAQKICECLAAPARVEILKLILSNEANSLDCLAKTLHLTNGAITQHVKKLCDVGLITLVATPGKRGTAKRCVPAVDRIIIDIAADMDMERDSEFDIAIGAFGSVQVNPYCGIASGKGWIGERDDPRYFTYPERLDAALLYFNSGKLGWTLPTAKKPLSSLSISFEISSKPYGHGRTRESLVAFFLNDIKLGEATVDGEFNDRKGLFTPDGFEGLCSYGKYKTITVNDSGTYFDGIKIGSTVISDIDRSALIFSLSTENGIALFGKNYGDYDCGIRVNMKYRTAL